MRSGPGRRRTWPVTGTSPSKTAAALTPDGWLRTGDLGYLDQQQRIYLVDRAKDMIITGGENVYPAEVEKVLAAYPPLAEAAVIGVPDDRWGETVKAVVVARPGAVVEPAEVIAFCRGQLARFKCPHQRGRRRHAAAHRDRQGGQAGPARALLAGS